MSYGLSFCWLATEGVLFALGVGVYVSATRPIRRAGSVSLWSYVGLLLLLYIASIFAPPAPDIRAVALGNLLFLPSLFWAGWIERTRALRKQH
jgi:hypothetical protein